jgi:hypothetical protein
MLDSFHKFHIDFMLIISARIFMPFVPVLNITAMPSEASFKKQAELAREALTNFNTIRQLKAPGLIKTALLELVETTVRLLLLSFILRLTHISKVAFNNFVPFFVSHVLFQEIPPAVHTAIEDFVSKNPDFEMPPLTHKIAGLDARVKDSLVNQNSRKGSVFPLIHILLFEFLLIVMP